MILVAEGKRTINYNLNNQQTDDLFFEMEVAPKLTLQQQHRKLRTRFYWSSALFTLSLAVPLIASGIGYVNYGLYISNKNNIDSIDYQQAMYIATGIAIGSGILSGILLGLNIADFIRYTKASKALAITEFTPRKVLPEEAKVKKEKTKYYRKN